MTMNFFNKAKETAAKLATDNKESGLPKPVIKKPGLKPTGAKASIPAKPGHLPAKPGHLPAKPGNHLPKPGAKPVPKTETAAPKVEEKVEEKNTSPLAKNNPFKKKAVKADTKSTVTSDDVLPVSETSEDKAKEVIKPKEEPKEETKEVKEAEPAKETKKTAAKKNTTKKTTAKKAEETSEDVSQEKEVQVSIPTTEVDFSTAIAAIKSSFVDEGWEKMKAELSEKINSIVITSDMNSKILKSTVAKLDKLRDEIRDIYTATKNEYDELTSKEPEGFIERVKRLSSKGSNAEDRKLNGIIAVMNYHDAEGNKINLYEVLDEIRGRYNFLKSIMDAIAYKNNVLVTMLGSLKLEK